MIKITMWNWRVIDLSNIESYEFTPEELARPISMVNRYSGGLIRPLSVAEHSFKLSGAPQVVERKLSRAALIHDLNEGIMTDLINPMKRDPQFKPYLELEEKVQRHLFNMFGIPWSEMEELIEFDRRICEDEVNQLRPGGRGFGYEPLGVKYDPNEDYHWTYWFQKIKEAFNDNGLS